MNHVVSLLLSLKRTGISVFCVSLPLTAVEALVDPGGYDPPRVLVELFYG